MLKRIFEHIDKELDNPQPWNKTEILLVSIPMLFFIILVFCYILGGF